MSVQLPIGDTPSRPSRVIAEALVGRHGPQQIAAQAAAIGLPRQLTQVILVACTSTATDNTQRPKKNAFAAS